MNTFCYLTDAECMKTMLVVQGVLFMVVIVIPVAIITWRAFHK